MAGVGTMPYPPRAMPQDYGQQYSVLQTRAHQPREGLPVNPYATYAPMPQAQSRQQPISQPPNPNPSASSIPAPDDGSRPSLPSISNLLGIVDGDRSSTQDNALQQDQTQQQQAHAHSQQQLHQEMAAQPILAEQRQSAAHSSLSTSHRSAIPPAPPFRNDSVAEGGYSPSTISTGSSLSGPSMFAASAINNLEPYEQRMVAQQPFAKRPHLPTHAGISPFRTSPYSTSPYSASPGTISTGSYYSPNDAPYHSSLYSQRPLPSNFPPPPSHMPPPSSETSPAGLATPNPWEHHHYISASSQATFPQSQDRYICQTCNKAFSRPSSLKIHSHSHTGEKPYHCPHAGCGKAFSVRSNMKRHERGCHTGNGGTGGPMHIR